MGCVTHTSRLISGYVYYDYLGLFGHFSVIMYDNFDKCFSLYTLA